MIDLVSPESIQTLSASEYQAYYYVGIGFASGCIAGYGFALRTTLKASREMIDFYKNELAGVKERVRELESQIYGNVIDRRHHPRD